ncbi:MAG: hypothetical protein HPM95_15395 [Alphaproteobacteria bacterium]|nr:hypothetical protein [Alphaproteobacteria bacterium]
MVGTGKVGQVKPTVTGPSEQLRLDETKVLGARLNGASMVKRPSPLSSLIRTDRDDTSHANIMIRRRRTDSPAPFS